MPQSDFYTSDSDNMMDFDELEDELVRSEAVALQGRVIEQQGQDIFRSIMALDAGVPSAQTLRVQKQLLTKLHALLSSGALAAPLREPVGEEHLKLIQFYNEVVRPQDFDVTTEDIQRDSESDEDDTETESMSEDDEDSVIVIESSSDEEFEPEDEAVARDNDYRDAFLSRETDSESEDEDRFRNLNVFYI